MQGLQPHTHIVVPDRVTDNQHEYTDVTNRSFVILTRLDSSNEERSFLAGTLFWLVESPDRQMGSVTLQC
jgi:hypothetical protein